jgi:hypothetical protein
MKNHIETVLGTLLDYYGNFERSPVIAEMVQAAGEKAGIVPIRQAPGVRYLADDEIADVAAAGMPVTSPDRKDKHG